MAKTYKSPVSGEEYTAEQYAALSVAEKRAEGFIHDVAVVYERVEDKVPAFDGKKQYTLEAYTVDDNGNPVQKIPVGTKIFGMEEAHFNFNGVTPVTPKD